MAQLEYDGIDIAALIPFMAGSLASLGLWNPGLPLVDVALTDALWTFSADGYTTQISIAILLSLSAVAIVMATNDVGFGTLTTVQIWVVLVTVWLILAPPFVPLLSAVLESSQWAGFVAFLIQSVGITILGFLG